MLTFCIFAETPLHLRGNNVRFMAFTPDANQKRIFDFIKDGKGNAVVRAVAGSGKTTTIVEGVRYIPKDESVAMMAFNTDIVEEVRQKVPAHIFVSTLHSAGWNAIQKTRRTKLNTKKYREIIMVKAMEWGLYSSGINPIEYTERVHKLVTLGRLSLSLNVDSLEETATKHDIQLTDYEAIRALEVIGEGRKDITQLDFTDMIFIAATERFVELPRFKWVFLDEAQDISVCQQELVMKMIAPGGRFIAVGDPAQAIYGFAGADTESFDKFRTRPDTVELPLSVSYRCSKEVVKYAQTVMKEIQPYEKAVEGEIVADGDVADIREGDFVLCRLTRPLVGLCFHLISRGTPAYILGRDIGRNLITLIKSTKALSLDGLWLKLDKEHQRIGEKILRQNPELTKDDLLEEAGYVMFQHKIDTLREIALKDSVNNPADLIREIDGLFHDKREGIRLATIHKAKGLEAERVFILEPDLMPSKWAKKPWQKEQEHNLMYVAYTRAKKTLAFIKDWKPNKKGRPSDGPKTDLPPLLFEL